MTGLIDYIPKEHQLITETTAIAEIVAVPRTHLSERRKYEILTESGIPIAFSADRHKDGDRPQIKDLYEATKELDVTIDHESRGSLRSYLSTLNWELNYFGRLCVILAEILPPNASFDNFIPDAQRKVKVVREEILQIKEIVQMRSP